MDFSYDDKELQRPAKRIGHTDEEEEVFESVLKGGIVVIEARKRGQSRGRRIGAGPLRGLARFIAKKRLGDSLQLTELSKSEQLPAEYWIHLVPEYEAVTDALNQA